MRRSAFALVVSVCCAGTVLAQTGRAGKSGPLDLSFLKPRGIKAPEGLGPPLKGQVVDDKTELPLDYPLREEHGPALLVVATYVGKDGSRLANLLCRELRERHGLAAYAWRHQEQADPRFREWSEEEIKAYVKQFARMPRLFKYQIPPPAHFGVLVGDFRSLDHDRAMDRVKARLLALSPNDFSEAISRELRWGYPEAGGKKPQLMNVRGVLNPLRPKSVNTEKALADLKLMRKLNSGANSVYQLNGKYTISLYRFYGAMALERTADREAAAKEKAPAVDTLTVAAENAEKLCGLLRGMGYDARTYHDLNSSAVCLGAYQSREDPRMLADLQRSAAIPVGALKLQPEPLELPVLFAAPMVGN